MSLQVKELQRLLEAQISIQKYGKQPASLYEPIRYLMGLGGKRLRPLLTLFSYNLYKDDVKKIIPYAVAVEAFHNFTLMHDDIMDKAPLRRGQPTIHARNGLTAGILGDVMLVTAYDYLNKISGKYLFSILNLFNQTAREVCEGQQLDMDFEQSDSVKMDDYLNMISLKTSVLLAASLKMGAILGGAGERNQNLLYEFGRKLGLAFQVQDDYLDAFGDPEKFGKQVGGDIKSNKKTFLLIHALETASLEQKQQLIQLLTGNGQEKVQKVLFLFRQCKVDEWANELKEKFITEAFTHLDDIAVLSKRKEPLKQLALYLTQRQK